MKITVPFSGGLWTRTGLQRPKRLNIWAPPNTRTVYITGVTPDGSLMLTSGLQMERDELIQLCKQILEEHERDSHQSRVRLPGLLDIMGYKGMWRHLLECLRTGAECIVSLDVAAGTWRWWKRPTAPWRRDGSRRSYSV